MKAKLLKISPIIVKSLILLAMTNLNATAQAKTDAKIEVKEVAAQKALTIKAEASMADISTVMGNGYKKLFDYLAENKITPVGPPSCVYYSWDVETGQTVFDMCVPVASKMTSHDDIVYKEFPAMKVARKLFVGPYDKMEPVYMELEKYMEENKLEKAGTVWDVYLTDPEVEKDPNKYQTIIYYVIK